jgi:hypothetical protein
MNYPIILVKISENGRSPVVPDIFWLLKINFSVSIR